MIRLRRHGAKRDPHYRVVVTEDSDSRDGPFLEIVGHYHPRKQPAEIVLDLERTDEWVGKGAQMSDTVASLYRRVKSGKVEGTVTSAPTPAPAPAATEPEPEPEPEPAVAAAAEAAEESPSDEADSAEASESSDGAGDEEE